MRQTAAVRHDADVKKRDYIKDTRYYVSPIFNSLTDQ